MECNFVVGDILDKELERLERAIAAEPMRSHRLPLISEYHRTWEAKHGPEGAAGVGNGDVREMGADL